MKAIAPPKGRILQGGLDPDITAWALSHKKALTMSLPSRAPNEPDVNEEQIAEILALSAGIDVEKLKELGTWQAAAVIQRIRDEKQALASEVIGTAWAEQNRRNLNAFIGAVIIVGLISLIVYFLW